MSKTLELSINIMLIAHVIAFAYALISGAHRFTFERYLMCIISTWFAVFTLISLIGFVYTIIRGKKW